MESNSEKIITKLKLNLSSNPDSYEINREIAGIFLKKKDFSSSIKYFSKIVNLKQKNSDFESLAKCYQEIGEFNKAIEILEKLIKASFSNASIYNNIGVAYKNIKKYQSALNYFDSGIKKYPSDHLLNFNKANLFKEVSDFKNAKKNFAICLEKKKDFFPALINLASINLQENNLNDALKNLNYAKTFSKDNPIILENLAKVHLVKKNYLKAESYVKKIIDMDPTSINKMIPIVLGYSYLGDEKNYQKSSRFYTEHLCLKSSIFSFNHLKKKKKIKIGFLSPDIRNHPIGYFLKDLLPKLSLKLDVSIYSTSKYDDEISAFAKKNCKWRDFHNVSQERISELIFDDKVDVLFDLSGITRQNNLEVFKLRPSPKQVSWAGWLATTNLKQIDYIIGDVYATPKKDDKNFIEKVYRMKNIWCVYSKSEINNLKVFNDFYSSSFIFGCFQRPEKITNNALEIWSKILSKKKDSYLFFNNASYQDNDEKIITKFFNKRGVKKTQIRFNRCKNRSDYLNAYNMVDINLDTFPYNGGTTSFESSYMGVPTLTMVNDSNMFRCGESINNNLDMSEWIAKDENDYLEKALEFSGKKYCEKLKKELKVKSKSSNLFNTTSFAKNFIKMIYEIL